jgi:hypothetical protein
MIEVRGPLPVCSTTWPGTWISSPGIRGGQRSLELGRLGDKRRRWSHVHGGEGRCGGIEDVAASHRAPGSVDATPTGRRLPSRATSPYVAAGHRERPEYEKERFIVSEGEEATVTVAA